MRTICYIILSIKYVLLYPLYLRLNKCNVVREEFEVYLKNDTCPYMGWLALVWMFECHPEYRNVFYMRFRGTYTLILSKLYKGLDSLFLQINNDNVGKNLMIWHGFSTIVNAVSIGDNCSIWQQVTIGNKLDNGESKPRIGNNVKICAGAIIVGDISIGDNVIIGAGTVVVKDVPSNSIVVGGANRTLENNQFK